MSSCTLLPLPWSSIFLLLEPQPLERELMVFFSWLLICKLYVRKEPRPRKQVPGTSISRGKKRLFSPGSLTEELLKQKIESDTNLKWRLWTSYSKYKVVNGVVEPASKCFEGMRIGSHLWLGESGKTLSKGAHLSWVGILGRDLAVCQILNRAFWISLLCEPPLTTFYITLLYFYVFKKIKNGIISYGLFFNLLFKFSNL